MELLRAGQSKRLTYQDAPGGGVTVFVDSYPAKPSILIFGAVHVGVALARLAKVSSDYRVVVIDARGQWATTERFPDVDEIHIQRADDYLAAHPIGGNTFVAVLSHDPKLDDPALIGALKSPARYVGAIGSPRTQAQRRERLKAAGLTDAQLERLHGPIGLRINAQTPEEIALSILGEMIAVKNASPALAESRRDPVGAGA
jgi:xanthine dehydrogenase accessory factor